MRQGIWAQPWCVTCGTAHEDPRNCPGELRATAAEKPGWRVEVETPLGHEAFGVLLAPSHDVWRARVMTFPNVLWSIPGGRGAIKFVGESREQAERQAIAFIEAHILAKRYQRRDGLGVIGGSPVPPRALHALTKRKPTCLPVRFGVDRASHRGTTVNLSDDGMFIGSTEPTEIGRGLWINLEVSGHTLPLRGLVMWSRRRPEPGRPLGIGVRLSDPPPFYQSYVAALPS